MSNKLSAIRAARVITRVHAAATNLHAPMSGRGVQALSRSSLFRILRLHGGSHHI